MSTRRGTYVWVVGPDGCGKSSIAAEVAGATGALHRYWRPGVLPLARELVGNPQEEGVNSEPHAVEANTRWREALRLAYYLVDYVVGYWFVFRPALRRGQDVVVERGWYDMGVDWRRYGLRSERSAGRLRRFVHEPDLLLVVTVPADEAIRRKPELTAAEIDRQYAEWERLPLRRSRRVALPNTSSLDGSVQEALQLLERPPR